MSKYGNSYSGNSFLEWWKTHYGTDYDGKSGIVKTEGMTDEDVAIGKSLLNSYNEQQLLTQQYNENVATETDKYNSLIESSDKAYDSQLAGAQAEYDTSAKLLLDNYNKNSATAKDIYDRNTAELLSNYGTAQNALDKSKRQSQQNASITLDKLKKYLPTQIKAQGLGGLGVSESSMLQAYNNYNSEMGSIESGYQESKTNLDTNYNSNKNAYDTAYQETQGSLDEMYGQSKANLDNSFNTTKVNLESAKSQASDTFKAQLADSLAKLKQGYDAGIFASDKDANGNLLVDNVLQEYAKMLSEEQGVNYATALEAIRNAVYTTGDEMNAFVEQYRGKVNDQQLAALFQEGTNVANVNAENARQEGIKKTEQEQALAFSSAQEAIINSGLSSQEEMNTFVEQFRGKVSDSQFASLQATAQATVSSNISGKYTTQMGVVQDGLAQMLAEPSNYTTDGTKLTEQGRQKMLDYIEQNKASIGDANYTALKTQIEGMAFYSNSERNSSIATAINAFTNNSNFNSQLSQYYDALNILESHKGTLTNEEYNSFLAQINSGTRVDYNNYYVQGLGSGRNNDDIDITIGSTSRNKNTEYDLLCGDEVTNDSAKKLLNKLTTGTESVTPSEGKLCVVANRMYIYTSKGWRNVKPDNSTSALSNAISAFLTTGKSSGNTKPSEPVTYPSDSEISNKAQSGTLTYHDVAKYSPGIRTQSEFARGNNSDKQKYGTYQNYLKAMYEKYKP